MSQLKKLFNPTVSRNFAGKRWLKISLRTAHLLGVAGVSGGILFNVPADQWLGYLHLTLATGLTYLALELWTNAILVIQLRGLFMAAKCVLLALLYAFPEYSLLVWLIIVLSSVISHAPGNFRYFRLI